MHAYKSRPTVLGQQRLQQVSAVIRNGALKPKIQTVANDVDADRLYARIMSTCRAVCNTTQSAQAYTPRPAFTKSHSLHELTHHG